MFGTADLWPCCMCVCLVKKECVLTILTEQTLYPWGTHTLPSHRVTRASILTAAQTVTGMSIGSLWASYKQRVGVGAWEKRKLWDI